MRDKSDPIEVDLEAEAGVDEGRRGFLKIFGAAAVGAAVAGKGVAEAAKLIAAKPPVLDPAGEPGDPPTEDLDIGTSDSWYRPPDGPVSATGFDGVLEEDTRVKAHPGEEVLVEPVHPWNLVLEYRDWSNVDREIVVPFIGSNIDVEVPESIKYIKAIYVVATEKTPRGAESPTITLRRGYSALAAGYRSGVKDPWMGEIDRKPEVRTFDEDDLKKKTEEPESVPEVPDLGYYERVKEERLAKNLRRRIIGKGGVIREDGTFADFSEEEEI